MRIDLAPTPGNNLTLLTLSHGEESATWNANAYERAEFNDLANLFDNINGYWASLPAFTQQRIWEIYQQMHDLLLTSTDTFILTTKLQKEVKVLYELMPFESIRQWVSLYGNVRIPISSSKDAYTPDHPEERTYLRNDYMDLASLAIALRPMIPVWGIYINIAKDYNGTDFKEFVATSLLYMTKIIDCRPMEKLKQFVANTMAFQEVSNAAIIRSLGSSEMNDWILAKCLTRRVALAEVNNPDETASIVSNVFRFISSNAKSMDRNFDGRVSDKNKPGSSGSEEDNSSNMEMFKVKPDFPDGDLVMLNVATENIGAMVAVVDSTIPLEVITACLNATQAMERMPISDHVVRLVQWVIDPVLSACGVPYLAMPAFLRTVAVTQAALWHWGLYDLAALVTAVPRPSGRDTMVGSSENRPRIPKEVSERLAIMYPYYRRARSRDRSVRQLNLGCKAIDGFCDLITHTEWQSLCPPELLALTQRHGKTNRLIVPTDIRAQLGEMFERINPQ